MKLNMNFGTGMSRLLMSGQLSSNRLSDREHILAQHISYLKGQGVEYGVHPKRTSTLSPYPPFQISIHTKIGIEELKKRLNCVQRGKFLLCRVIAPSFGRLALNTLVDDQSGSAVLRLSVSGYHCHPGIELDLLDAGIPIATILAIKNPILMQVLGDGLTLNCDYSEDVVVLGRDVLKNIGGLNWVPGVPDLFLEQAGNILMGPVIEEERVMANIYYTAGCYERAIKFYSTALRAYPNNYEMLELRISAYIKEGAYGKALRDTEVVLEGKPDSLSGQNGKALALCGLKKYPQAVRFLSRCVPEDEPSGSHPFRDGMIEMKLRLKEQLQGLFDARFFFRRERYHPEFNAFNDCAEYVSSDLRQIFYQGKGRGVIVTRDVLPGELLMACKAFITYDPALRGHARVGFGFEGEPQQLTKDQMHDAMVKAIIGRLNDEPYLANEFYVLYAGPDLTVLHFDALVHPLIDRERIGEIVRYNTRYHHYTSRKLGDFTKRLYASLTIVPSFLNHSCVSNSLMDSYREFTFVRSHKFIPRGQEVTVPYFDLRLPYKIRRSKTENLGFLCTCQLCEADAGEHPILKERRNKILELSGPYLQLLEPSDSDIDKLITYMNQLDQLRPQSKLNFALESFVYKLALYFGTRNRFDKTLIVSKKGYYMFNDSPLISSVFIFLALIVVCCVKLNKIQERNTWSNTMKQFMVVHERFEPVFDEIKEMILNQFEMKRTPLYSS